MDNLARKPNDEPETLCTAEQAEEWLKNHYKVGGLFIGADSKYHIGDSLAVENKNIFLIRNGSPFAKILEGRVKKIDDEDVLGKIPDPENVQVLYNNLTNSANDEIFEPRIESSQENVGIKNNVIDIQEFRERRYEQTQQLEEPKEIEIRSEPNFSYEANKPLTETITQVLYQKNQPGYQTLEHIVGTSWYDFQNGPSLSQRARGGNSLDVGYNSRNISSYNRYNFF